MRDLRRSEDTYVDRLVGAVQKGAPLISARFPRCYCDVNREPYELDPRMFAEPLCRQVCQHRIAAGRWRPWNRAPVVGDRQAIYQAQDSVCAMRLSAWKPSTSPIIPLCGACSLKTHVRFGAAVLVDCHSMPSVIRTAIAAR